MSNTICLRCCGTTKDGQRCKFKGKHRHNGELYCKKHLPKEDPNMKEILFTEEEDCPICYCSMKDTKVYETCCNHHFHKHCLNKWLEKNDNCPICRKQLKEKKQRRDIEELTDVLTGIRNNRTEQNYSNYLHSNLYLFRAHRQQQTMDIIYRSLEREMQLLEERRNRNRRSIFYRGY